MSVRAFVYQLQMQIFGGVIFLALFEHSHPWMIVGDPDRNFALVGLLVAVLWLSMSFDSIVESFAGAFL